MKILAFEFSSARRTVAVGGSNGAHSRPLEDGARQREPFEVIEEVLREAALLREEIRCIAVGLGPGSYTGVRLAIAIAQGWELALGVRLLGISSAEAIAREAQAAKIFGLATVVIDAQRGELYRARYEIDADDVVEREPMRIATLDEVRALERAGEPIVGPEATSWFASAQPLFPSATALLLLAARRCEF